MKNEYNDKKGNGKISIFIKSSISNTATKLTGSINSPRIGNASLYMETSNNNHEPNVYCSFERKDIIHFTNIFSITNDTQIQVIFPDQQVDCGFNFYYEMANGLQITKLIKLVNIVQIKPIGLC